jgi:KEOPS complex subunit Pcc1
VAHESTLVFEYADATSAARVAAAVGPEEDDIDGDRTTATVTVEGRTLELAVAAEDLVALRAGLNTWCSLVAVAERAGGVSVA